MSVVIDVKSRSEQAQKDLDNINRSLQNIHNNTSKINEMFAAMGKGLAYAGAAAGLFMGLQKVSDKFTQMGNQIALVTGRTGDLIYAQEELMKISDRTRGTLDASAAAFSQFGKSLKGSGTGIDDLLKVVENIQKSVSISGAEAASANAAIIQLGQGLASGTLRGQELTSVMEQIPRLAMAIADGMNVSLGSLRKMGEEGQITTDVILKALLSQTEKINEEFALMAPTLGQGFTALSNALQLFVSELNSGLGITDAFGGALSKISALVLKYAQDIKVIATIWRANFDEIVGNVLIIAKPIGLIFKALWDQLIYSLPTSKFVITLKGQILEAGRAIDDFFNNWISRSARKIRFAFMDALAFDSDVEKAIKVLRRLSPSYWFTGSWEKYTIERFFRRETVFKFAKAFDQLALGIQNNMNSIGWGIGFTMGNILRRVSYGIKDTLRYLGVQKNTLFTIRIGNVDNLIGSLSELYRGLTRTGRKVYEWGRILSDTFAESYTPIISATAKWFTVLPERLREGFKIAVTYIKEMLMGLAQILYDMWFNQLFSPLQSVSIKIKAVAATFKSAFTKEGFQIFSGNPLIYFVQNITNTLKVVIGYITTFIRDAINVFREFYSGITGSGSWWNKAIDFIKNSFKNIFNFTGSSISGALGASSKFFSRLSGAGKAYSVNLAETYARIVAAREIKYWFTLSPSMLQRALHSFDMLTAKILIKSLELYDRIGNPIEKMARMVSGWFAWIYDKVIGHSYWVDLIDGIIRHTHRLVNTIGAPLSKFKEKVISTFQSLPSILGSLGEIDSGGSLKNFFNTVVENTHKLFALLKEDFPIIMRMVGYSLATLAAALFFPSVDMKIAIVASLAQAVFGAASMLSEDFVYRLFNTSAVAKVAKAIGHYIGEGVNEFVKELPKYLSMILGALTNVFRGIVERLPFMIGTISKAVFWITDKFGATGPLGILGLYLLGTKGGSWAYKIPVIGNALEWLFAAGKKGASAGILNTSGLIGKYLFGNSTTTDTKTRLWSAIGLLASFTGGLDSIFNGSKVAEYGADAGLIAGLLFGEQAVKSAINLFTSKYWVPLSKAISDVMKKTPTGINNWSLFDLLFGTSGVGGALGGGTTSNIKVALSQVWDTIIKYVTDWQKLKSIPFMGKALSWLETFFLGPDPALTVHQVRMSVLRAWLSVSNSTKAMGGNILGKISASPITGALVNAWAAAGSAISAGWSKLAAQWAAFMTFIRGSSTTTAAAASVTLSTLAKRWLIATAVVTTLAIAFMSMANAAEVATGPLSENYSIASELVSTYEQLFKVSPWKTIATSVLAVVAAMLALRYSLVAIKALWSGISKAGSIEMVGNAIGYMGMTPNRRLVRAGAVTGVTAGAGAAMAGGSPTDIIGSSLIGFLAGSIMQGGLEKIFGKLAASGTIKGFLGVTLRALVHPVTAILLGLGAVGALAVSAFGEGINWVEKFEDAINKLRGRKTGYGVTKDFENQVPNTLRKVGSLEYNPNFNGIDWPNISQDKRDRLTKLQGKIKETLERAKDELDEFGEITPETSASFIRLKKAVDAQISNFEAQKREDWMGKMKNLNMAQQPDYIRGSGQTPVFNWLPNQFMGLEKSFISMKYDSQVKEAQKALDKYKESITYQYPYKKDRDIQTEAFLSANLDQAIKQRDEFQAGGMRFTYGYRSPTKNIQELQKAFNDINWNTDDLIGNKDKIARDQKALQDAFTEWFKSVTDLTDFKDKNKGIITGGYGRFARPAMAKMSGNWEMPVGESKLQELQLSANTAEQIALALAKQRKEHERLSFWAKQYDITLKNIDDDLQAAGIKLEYNLHMLGNTDFERQIAEDARTLRALRESIALGDSSEERARRELDYLEKKNKLQEKLDRQKLNTSTPDDILKSRLDKVQVGFDVSNFKSLPEEIKKEITARIDKFNEINQTLLDKQFKFSRPGLDKVAKQNLSDEIQAMKNAIDQEAEDLSKYLMDKILGNPKEKEKIMQQKQPIGEVAGYIKGSAWERYKKIREDLSLMDFADSFPTSANKTVEERKADALKRARLNREKNQIEQAFTPLDISLNSTLGALQGLSLNELLQLRPSVAKELMNTANNLAAIKKQADLFGTENNFGLMNKINSRETYLKNLTENLKEKLPTSFTAKIQKITNLGVTTDTLGLEFDPQKIAQIDELDKKIAHMTNALNRTDIEWLPDELQIALNKLEEWKPKQRAIVESLFNSGKQLEFINSIFADLNLSNEDWVYLTRENKTEVFKLAQEYRDLQEELKKTQDEQKRIELHERMKVNRRRTESISETSKTLFNWDITQLEKAGIQADKLQFGRLPSESRANIGTKANQLRKLQQEAEGIPENQRAEISAKIAKALEEINDLISSEILKYTSKGFTKIEAAGGKLSNEVYATLGESVRNELLGISEKILLQIAEVKRLEDSPEQQRAAALILYGLQKNLADTIANKAVAREDTQSYKAGQSLIESVKSSMQSGIADFIKGKTKGKDAIIGIMDAFTNSIIDSFVGGIIGSFTGKGGIFERIFQGIGEGSYGLFDNILKMFGLKGNQSQPEKDSMNFALNDAAAAVRELSSTIRSAFGMPSVGEPGSVPGMPEQLSGPGSPGYVPYPEQLSGPGMPTAIAEPNGINSPLTNGQMAGIGMAIGSTITAVGAMLGGKTGMIISIIGMVLTTLSTIMMYQAIQAMKPLANGGAFLSGVQKFAHGGVFNSPHVFRMANGGIGMLGEAGPEAIMPLVRGSDGKLGVRSQGSGSSVFNINITGDISRQTRSEIQRMIPMIASGVNQHNYETGIQR